MRRAFIVATCLAAAFSTQSSAQYRTRQGSGKLEISPWPNQPARMALQTFGSIRRVFRCWMYRRRP